MSCFKAPIAFFYHPFFLEHKPPKQCPEKPGRLLAILRYLKTLPALASQIRFQEPSFSRLQAPLYVHPKEYVEAFARNKEGVFLADDCYTSARSFEVASLACACVVQAADAIMEDQVGAAFCALRPPGHHAEACWPMSFCFFNHVAVAARYLRMRYGLKIFILDWDAHHGNGTQSLFFEDPNVFFCSMHQFSELGSGLPSEIGAAAGRNATLNCCLAPRSDDGLFLDVLAETVLPAMDRFKPEFVLISAGFDAHAQDPVSQLCLTENGFFDMTRLVLERLQNYGHRRVLSVLEGGYHPQALARSVAAHLQAFLM